MFNKKILKLSIKRGSAQAGQAMLLAVLLIGASVMAFTSIAGYMTLTRMKTSSNITDTAKAIMAADAGIECELYNKYKDPDIICNNIVFGDGTKIQTVPGVNLIKSAGISNKTHRAFSITIQ